MLNKILSIFGYKPKEDSPPVEEPKKDISEPVVSFINTLKANPKRFKIVWLNREEYINSISFGKGSFKEAEYVLIDRVSGEKFPFSHLSRHYYSLPDYLTDDEKGLVKEVVKEFANDRKDRLLFLRNKRASRVHQKERNRLKEIYCDL